MLKLLVVVAAAILVVSARKFDNPILDNADYPDPGATKVGDWYYVVTTTNNDNPEKFPIHRSPDIQHSWDLVRYVFNASHLPPWSNKDHEFWAPELHKINLPGFDWTYNAYFTSRDTISNKLSIGVAYSESGDIRGPYKSLDRPLWTDPNGDVLDATFINDNETYYLVWKAQYWINARQLSWDGLSFASDETIQIMKPDFPWEDNLVEAPFYVRRGKYLFYSGHDMCSNLYAVGVARSLNAMGPYEKRGEPILRETDKFPGPGHNSVVFDRNDKDYVIFYHSWKKYHVCGDNPRLTNVASLGWDEDDWPYVFDNE